MEFRKAVTDKKGHIFYSSKWIKQRDLFPLEHRLREERIRNGKKFLVNEHQSIEICYT